MELEKVEAESVNALKSWLENEEEIESRTDGDFLLLFLRACKFDLPKTKKKLKMYYESRVLAAEWWAERNLSSQNILSLLQLKMTTAMMETDLAHPNVTLTLASRYGPNLNNFNDYGKIYSIIIDVIIRRQCCQKNGFIWVVDCLNYPMWMALKMLSITTVKKIITSFCLALPIRVKKVVILNTPTIAFAVCKLVFPLISKKITKRIHFFGTDWSKLGEQVPLELLPIEYGGHAGALQKHEDAFLEEVWSYADYIMEDNKYGIKRKES